MTEARKILSVTTKTPEQAWRPIEGFPTGMGEDFYFVSKYGKGHVNRESGCYTITLNGIEVFVGSEEDVLVELSFA